MLNQQAVAEALNSDVPPRDAAERVTFATWAIVTGKSPGGIFNALPKLDDEAATKMAQRLSERAEGPISSDDVKAAATIEDLATTVREYLEAGQIDGFVRTIRARPEGSTKPPVFVFHAAGGSTVVYEPLLNRLPPDTPMYGFERVEGTIEERAAQYVPKLRELQGDGPFILVGWSLGGVLAYACAIGLKQQGCDVPFVGLIDAVRAGEEIPQTKEETRKRWERYARFAERTFNVEIPEIPYEQLEELDDEGQVKFVLEAVKAERRADPRRDHRASAHVVSGQPRDRHRQGPALRRSCHAVHGRPLSRRRDHVRAALCHAQARRRLGRVRSDLEVVPIGGEHIQAIDEPIIAKVGAHMTQALNKIDAEQKEA